MAIRVSDLRNEIAKTVPGSYGDLDDRMLVLDFQAGNAEAFVEIHRRYAGLARHVCQRILANPEDADEATQETMLRVFQGLPRFNGRYALQPWVARIATNISLDVTRAQARRPKVADRALADLHEALLRHEDDPLEAVERQMERTEVLAVLATLPEHHRDALVLREFEGRSHKEIGDALGVTPAQAKALIHRAKRGFRQAWNRSEERARRGLGALVPILLTPFKLPHALRRIFLPVTEGAGGAASQAAASATASPAVVSTATFSAERVTTAAVAVLTAATVAVGASVAVHKARSEKPARPSPSVAVVVPPSPAPQVKTPSQVEKIVRVRAPEARGKAAAPAPVESVAPTPSPTESSSPSPSTTEGATTAPTIPPAPPWSLSFDSSVPVGTPHLELISSRVAGVAGASLLFSQTVSGPIVDDKGVQTGHLYVEYWGSADGMNGTAGFWITLDTPQGSYLYDATGVLASLTTKEGVTSYVFSGAYHLSRSEVTSDGSGTEEAVVPQSGAVTLALGFWADGTSLYDVGLSLQEAAAASPSAPASPTG